MGEKGKIGSGLLTEETMHGTVARMHQKEEQKKKKSKGGWGGKHMHKTQIN